MEISTGVERAELAMVNWVAWQNTAKSFKLSLNGRSEAKTHFVDVDEALCIERVLLHLKALQKKVYKALVVYFQQRDVKTQLEIANQLGIHRNTLQYRRDAGLRHIEGYLT